MNPPVIQAYYEIELFAEFFCGYAVFSNPQCPPPIGSQFENV